MVTHLLYVCLLTASFAFSNAENITAVIAAHRELATLGSLVQRFPGLVESLPRANATFFAPSNAALDTFIQSQGLANITTESVQNLLAYHLLPSVFTAENLRTPGGAIAETRLQDETFANLQGPGNVIFASAYGHTGLNPSPSDLMIYSGVGAPANVTREDLEFEGGVVHVIDRVLDFPRTCTQTAQAASLSTLTQAFRTAGLWETVDKTAKFTCFAPTDEAFQAAGINISALSTEGLTAALRYHSIVGEVGYSTALEDGKDYQTLLGVPVSIHKRDGQMFVNDVAVKQGNIIMSNGVAHILSGVLTPPSDPATTSPDANPTPLGSGASLMFEPRGGLTIVGSIIGCILLNVLL